MRSLSVVRSPCYHYIQDDENFRRWMEALQRGSLNTASV